MKRKPTHPPVYRVGTRRDITLDQKRRKARGIQKILCLVAVVLFVVPLFALGVTSLVDKDKTVSEKENRALKARPAFTFQALFNGSFTKNFEEYYADTFPLRDFFLSVNQKLSNVLTQAAGKNDLVLIEKEGKDDFGGEALTEEPKKDVTQEQETKVPYQPQVNDDEVYENGYILIDKDRKAALEIYGIDKTKIRKYTDVVNRLAQKLSAQKIYALLAPTATEFYSPEDYHTGNRSQKAGIAYAYEQFKQPNLKGVDAVSSIGMHLDEYLYFRTDHHWTARGAYYAYSAFCQAAGLEPVPLNALKSGRIEDFVGSMYRYTNADVLKNNPDYLEYFLPRRQAEGEYYDNASMKNGHHLTIVSTKVNADNKYLAFIQGDTPLSKIVTDQKNGKKILVIKDSFGNALVPFLTDNYEEIYVLDPRNIETDLSAFVKEHGIQDVLLINYSLIGGNTSYLKALDKMIG
ncbi:MAG: hypothetical protein KIC46_09100 [Clostridiales bacterium]|nr:hypothetical protein [Clostridiales bacterium]